MRFEETEDSWLLLKDQGRIAFESGDYATAVAKYSAALQPEKECPAPEQQLLLSNIVAARLKMGGRAQAEAAVEAAKKCVALNERWAKGHVRLATAYIALGGHSNDACNSLQRALQLDPNHPTARNMLMQELRRDSATRHQPSAPPEEFDETPTPSAPPETMDDRTYSSSSSAANTAGRRPTTNPYRDPRPRDFEDHHLTWQDKAKFYLNRAKQWYDAQSNDVRTILKVWLVLLVLYVAFGGRFGLGGIFGTNSKPQRGNYDSGNVYDQYYHRKTAEARRGYAGYAQQQEQDYYASSTSYSQQQQRSYDSRDSSYYNDDTYHRSNRGRGSSFGLHVPNLFDGSLSSMLVIGGILYVCHRNGINPMQALFFLNMMNGGRGRRRMHRGFGYGGGGMGGFGRRRW